MERAKKKNSGQAGEKMLKIDRRVSASAGWVSNPRAYSCGEESPFFPERR